MIQRWCFNLLRLYLSLHLYFSSLETPHRSPAGNLNRVIYIATHLQYLLFTFRGVRWRNFRIMKHAAAVAFTPNTEEATM